MEPLRLAPPIISSYSELLFALTKYVQRKAQNGLDPLVSRLIKSLFLLPPQAELTLQAWQVKIAQKYFARVPHFRTLVMQRMWACSEEERLRHHSTALKRIEELHNTKTSRIHQLSLPVDARCTLEGIELKHHKFTKHMVYFGGTKYLWERHFNHLWRLHTHLRVNITTYNYRATTPASTGDPTEEALHSDGMHIVQRVLKQGVVPKDIWLYGASLGGGISIKVGGAYARKGVAFDAVNERSYRCLPAVVAHAAVVAGEAFAMLIKSFGWLVRAEEEIHSLKGRLVVISHPRDRVITLPAQLRTAIAEKPPSIPVHFIEMKDKDPLSDHFTAAHCRDMTDDELDQLRNLIHDNTSSCPSLL